MIKGVNYIIRVLNKPAFKQEFLNLLVYVIHPESASCLGNHNLKFSRFSCHTGETWVANITLRTWRVNDYCEHPTDTQAQTFKDDEPIHLPDLQKLWQKDAEKTKERRELEMLCFELDVSSIVLSTNEFGDFSKCFVWSKLIGKAQMEDVVKETQKLWQKFVHQPQTGRCLVFLLVLSKMCEAAKYSYEKAINKLTRILELNVGPSLFVI